MWIKVSSLEAGTHSTEEVQSAAEKGAEEMEAMDVSRKPEEKPEAMESYFSSGNLGNSQISLVSTEVGSFVKGVIICYILGGECGS